MAERGAFLPGHHGPSSLSHVPYLPCQKILLALLTFARVPPPFLSVASVVHPWPNQHCPWLVSLLQGPVYVARGTITACSSLLATLAALPAWPKVPGPVLPQGLCTELFLLPGMLFPQRLLYCLKVCTRPAALCRVESRRWEPHGLGSSPFSAAC